MARPRPTGTDLVILGSSKAMQAQVALRLFHATSPKRGAIVRQRLGGGSVESVREEVRAERGGSRQLRPWGCTFSDQCCQPHG
ncbi:hypothetical protein E2C01_080311 [Portunus trituberculatus]|uniref:Uncharacterized protein n=1 Tax=Portunus trituberculatus TaxID=210409 RepID=A0A5B7IJD2_PORTR|nr:hypothetical protein [Portunus trituberculatus]